MGDPFVFDHPSAQSPYAVKVGANDPVASGDSVNSPLLGYDFIRRTDASGNPLWVNRGTLGTSGDLSGPGGAANPTALGDLPGYEFDGGDYLTMSGWTRPLSTTLSAWWYLDQLAGDYGINQILWHSYLGGNFAYILQASVNNFFYFHANGGVNYSSYIIPAQTWHHIYLQWDATGLHSYLAIDGVERARIGSTLVPSGMTNHRTGQGSTCDTALIRWYEGEMGADFGRAQFEAERHIFGV